MYQKVFPAELDYLYDMLEFIKGCEATHQLTSLALEQIILAAEEALVNIINYGYPDKKKGTIEIMCKHCSPKLGVKIVIKDQGIPFNPIEKVPTTPPSAATMLNEAENSLGGYGIYILIGLMDRVEYQRINGGNMLSLIKYIEEK